MFLSCFLRCIGILAYHIAICFNSNLWSVNEWVRDCCLTPRQHFFQLSYGGNKLSFYLFFFLQLHCLSFFEQLFLTIPLLSSNFSDFWWDDGDICFTNLPNWILIVLAHWNSSPHNSDTAYWLSISFCCLINAISSGKAANTNCIVFEIQWDRYIVWLSPA